MSYYFVNRSASELLAEQIETDRDYRVLRRLPHRDEIWCRSMPAADPGSTIVLGVTDCETTGLDRRRHQLFDLALVKLSIDVVTGDVLDVQAPSSWMEDPGEPLTPEIEALTGLSTADLQGCRFDDEEIRAAFAGVDLIVAHNASFDRAFIDARFPLLGKPVACSLAEVNWESHGFGSGRSLGSLLTSAGHFQQRAHRAEFDAWALCCLLMMRGRHGRSVAWHLVDRARRLTARIYARKAPYDLKDTLRNAGYRWAMHHRAWTLEREPELIANEFAWLTELHPMIQPNVVPIDWYNRHID